MPSRFSIYGALRARFRISYPFVWFVACIIVVFLAPSFLSARTSFVTRGSVILGLAGLVPYEVDHHFKDTYIASVDETLRRRSVIARREIRIEKKKIVTRSPSPGHGLVPYRETIERIAREHDVSPALAAAVIKVESGFKPNAQSVRGARGLMQLLPDTARKVGIQGDIYNPEHNIRAGIRYLKMLLDRYGGDERLALAAYNAGPAAVDRYNSVPPYRETRDYVPLVLQYSQEYSKHFQDI